MRRCAQRPFSDFLHVLSETDGARETPARKHIVPDFFHLVGNDQLRHLFPADIKFPFRPVQNAVAELYAAPIRQRPAVVHPRREKSVQSSHRNQSRPQRHAIICGIFEAERIFSYPFQRIGKDQFFSRKGLAVKRIIPDFPHAFAERDPRERSTIIKSILSDLPNVFPERDALDLRQSAKRIVVYVCTV